MVELVVAAAKERVAVAEVMGAYDLAEAVRRARFEAEEKDGARAVAT